MLVKSIPDFLGIFAAGNFPSQNIPAWYISAMLISMLALYYMLAKNRNFYIYVFCPIATVLLIGYRYMTFTELSDNPQAFDGILSVGIIKAVSGLCGGAVCWIICKKLKSVQLTGSGECLLSVTELILFVAICYCAVFCPDDRHIRIYTHFMFIPYVAIVFSGKSLISRLFDHKIFAILGKASLPLYLNHLAAKVIIMKYNSDTPFWENFIYLLGITVILSVIEYFGVRLVVKAAKALPLHLIKKVGE